MANVKSPIESLEDMQAKSTLTVAEGLILQALVLLTKELQAQGRRMDQTMETHAGNADKRMKVLEESMVWAQNDIALLKHQQKDMQANINQAIDALNRAIGKIQDRLPGKTDNNMR